MNYVRTDWTIVIAGAWNMGIFSPPWVAQHVFQAEQVAMEMQLGVATPVLRYSHGKVSLIVHPDKLIGAMREETDEALSEVTTVLSRTLRDLPHTPIVALGVNFGFREASPDATLLSSFNTPDSEKIIGIGGTVNRTSVQREIDLDGEILKLRETAEETGSIRFHFNFHYPVEDAASAIQILQDQAVGRRAKALELMSKVYGLTPEGSEEVEDAG